MDRKAFEQMVSDLQVVPPGATTKTDLQNVYQTAMNNRGGTFKTAEVLPRGGRFTFRYTVELPDWARRHVDDFLTEVEQAAQVKWEALAKARAEETLNKP